jgi:predicted SnoaL-like aldol condensation-catalyzing enzyme
VNLSTNPPTLAKMHPILVSLALCAVPACAIAIPEIEPTTVIASQKAIVTPPPCVAIVPAPSEAETEKRHDEFANAFLVTKNLTNAFEYISSTYINHNPFAEDGPDAALDFLGPVWPTTEIIVLRTAFNGSQGWLNYQASGIGTIVDRFRWESGCIVEHVGLFAMTISV